MPVIITKQQQQLMRLEACEGRMDEYIWQLADLAALDASQHDRAELAGFIKAGLRRGIVDHGLVWELDIVTFLAWRQLFGPQFDELPAVRDAFLSTRDETGSRLALIVRRLPLGIWEVAARRGAEKAGG
ncbi:MAG: hypothetical protein ACOYMG_28730 [Candidatus Methylumidiphilus sp.]